MQAEGYTTRLYSDSQAALAALTDNPPDLAVLDVKMPGMDGLACLKQLRLEAPSEPALRVVIVTALNDADKKSEALANGAEAYVLRPDVPGSPAPSPGPSC